MVLPTHIVATGGIVENDQGEILLVKTQCGVGLPRRNR